MLPNTRGIKTSVIIIPQKVVESQEQKGERKMAKIKTSWYKVELELIKPMLGATPKDPEIYASYIAAKFPDMSEELLEKELESVQKAEEKGWTGFHVDPRTGELFILAYVLKGHFKEACGALRRCKSSLSSKLTAYKKCIDKLCFVYPWQITLDVPEGWTGLEWPYCESPTEEGPDDLERPLRAETAQGSRVALARSDMVPEGTKLSFEVKLYDEVVTPELLEEWLDYGEEGGLRQWRNAGFGRFTYTMEKIEK